jgi:hypothetical protein
MDIESIPNHINETLKNDINETLKKEMRNVLETTQEMVSIEYSGYTGNINNNMKEYYDMYQESIVKYSEAITYINVIDKLLVNIMKYLNYNNILLTKFQYIAYKRTCEIVKEIIDYYEMNIIVKMLNNKIDMNNIIFHICVGALCKVKCKKIFTQYSSNVDKLVDKYNEILDNSNNYILLYNCCSLIDIFSELIRMIDNDNDYYYQVKKINSHYIIMIHNKMLEMTPMEIENIDINLPFIKPTFIEFICENYERLCKYNENMSIYVNILNLNNEYISKLIYCVVKTLMIIMDL